MIQDILTVMWKERKGLLLTGGSYTRTILTLLAPVAFFGLVFPLMFREDYFATAFPLAPAILLPFVIVSMTSAESFAGERERHTLSTLLASRLPDRAILFGKMGIIIAYGWISTLILLVITVIVANVVIGDGQFHFFEPMMTVALLLVSLLISLTVTLLGVLVSLRAPTVQGAQQTLLAAVLVPALIIQILPLVLAGVLSGEDIMRQIMAADFSTVVTVFSLILAGISVVLVVAVLNRFQRARLII